MSLRPQEVPPVPEETARVARAAFRTHNVYMRMRDEFGAVFADAAFAPLFPSHGQPAHAPWRLALVTIMQYAEGLSDEQAAGAVRGRIDWKYALSLELTDTGFDSSVLSEFRTRLVEGGAERLLFDTLLERFRERGLLKARGRQRTDATHVLAKVRALKRLECVGATLRAALNSLAVVAPAWVRALAAPAPDWVERYGRRVDDYRLPQGQEERQAYGEAIGRDGRRVLEAAYAPGVPAWLREVPAVRTLRHVWVQQFYVADGAVHWRTAELGTPPSPLMISSPYDLDAHYAKKRTTSWIGYKVHITEACEDDAPHLITHVETATAPTGDNTALPTIHAALAAHERLPGVHIVDGGYMDAELLVASRWDYDVDLLGPARTDQTWQARAEGGYPGAAFAVDWEAERLTCPEGRTSVSWTPAVDRKDTKVIKVKFAVEDCRPCPSRSRCTATAYPRRTVTIRRRAEYDALEAARAREVTPAFKEEYGRRAGIEGTISQATRTLHLRRCRYSGLRKAHLQHLLTAAAVNFVRVALWLDDTPRAKTRRSHFVALMQPAA